VKHTLAGVDLPNEAQARVSKARESDMEAAVKSLSLPLPVVIDDKISDGYVIDSQSSRFDFTVDSVLSARKTSLEPMIARVLFE
jgi:hypothetical protein